MKVTRESILGVGADTSEVCIGWERQNTPYTTDGKKKDIDSVEFEINHRGIEVLERNIESESEYIMCYVHFLADTEILDGIYLSVINENYVTDDNLDINILDENEKNILTEYALNELRTQRHYDLMRSEED